MNYMAIAENVPPRNGSGTQEWIYRVLRTGIILGELRPGMQLKQDEISDSLNVSHIPVREALRQLEAQNLVTIHTNRGASVAILTYASIVEMIEVMNAVRIAMLKKSIPQMTPEDISALDKLINQQKRATDELSFETANYDFNCLLTKASANKYSENILDNIYANIGRYVRSILFGNKESREKFIDMNLRLLTACKEKDINTAVKILEHKITAASSMLSEKNISKI